MPTISEDLKAKIRGLQDINGWFKNGHEQLYIAANQLLAKGLSEVDILEVLAIVYYATTNEYGD